MLCLRLMMFWKNPHVTYALCPFHTYFEVSRESDKPEEVRLTYARCA